MMPIHSALFVLPEVSAARHLFSCQGALRVHPESTIPCQGINAEHFFDSHWRVRVNPDQGTRNQRVPWSVPLKRWVSLERDGRQVGQGSRLRPPCPRGKPTKAGSGMRLWAQRAPASAGSRLRSVLQGACSQGQGRR
jgi:hypothetical protein